MSKEIDYTKIDMAITQRFKELEVRSFQVLGLIDPYFQRIIGGLMNEYKGYVMDIIKRETGKEGGP
jgi:hypothetical protein